MQHVAMRTIRRIQSTNLANRLVGQMSVEESALSALKKAPKTLIAGLLLDGCTCATLSGRNVVTLKDVRLALRLRGV